MYVFAVSKNVGHILYFASITPLSEGEKHASLVLCNSEWLEH